MHSDSGLTGLTFERPSLVKPQFADECDLTKIVSRFIRTGELPNLQIKKPLSIQDVTDMPSSLEEVIQFKIDCQNSFEQESEIVKLACQNNLEIYAEFKALSGSDQVEFLKSKGFNKDQILSVIRNPDLFVVPATPPANQQATPPANQQATPPANQQATPPANQQANQQATPPSTSL